MAHGKETKATNSQFDICVYMYVYVYAYVSYILMFDMYYLSFLRSPRSPLWCELAHRLLLSMPCTVGSVWQKAGEKIKMIEYIERIVLHYFAGKILHRVLLTLSVTLVIIWEKAEEKLPLCAKFFRSRYDPL